MSVTDIVYHAWNKDAANLKPSLDQEMSSRIADIVGTMKADVAASMFGVTTGETVTEQPLEQQDSVEDTPDENV
jgi:hypothetical protein